MNEDMTNTMKRLQEPFPAKDIEWRVQQSGGRDGNMWAIVLAYVTNRAIQNRLDDIFGADNWRNEYREWSDGAVICGLSIRIGGEWITKWDGADKTDIEPTKGGLSDSMKRAAVQWGIGRYLYNLEANFAEGSQYRPQGDGWKSAKTKDGKFYWRPPQLPDWALPEAERGKQHAPSKNAGNAPQSATNSPDDKNPGQAPKRALSIEERRKNLVIAVQQKFGVSRGELKDMMGVDPESFNDDEINIIREAAKIAKVQNCDFKTAFNQVKQ